MKLTMTGSTPEEVIGIATQWRNHPKVVPTLRTAKPTTPLTQENFYRRINSPGSKMRIWSFCEDGKMVAFGGFVNIQWENRTAEISLLIDPEKTRQGYGTEVAHMLYNCGFNHMNFHMIHGEVYMVPGGGFWFWKRFFDDTMPFKTLVDRKFWDGKYYDGAYFSVTNDEYRELYRPLHQS